MHRISCYNRTIERLGNEESSERTAPFPVPSRGVNRMPEGGKHTLALLPEDERVALELMVLDKSPDMLKRASDALRRGPSALYRIKARALVHLAELAAVAQGPA